MSDKEKHKLSRTDSTDGSERSLEIWDSISQHSGWEEWMRQKQEWDDYKEWLEEQKREERESGKDQEQSEAFPEAQIEHEVTIQDIEKLKVQDNIKVRSDSSGSLASRFTIDTNDIENDAAKLEGKEKN